jgi:hypothetical protein
MTSTLIHFSALAFFPALMALSASMDLLTFTIPNRICLSLALGYLVLAALLGVPPADILLNLSCASAILALAFVMFNLGWVGGGDAKLAAATAIWVGWSSILDYGLAAALRRRPDADHPRRAHGALARRACALRLGRELARLQIRGALWDRIGGGRIDAISGLEHLGGDSL